MRVKKTFPQPVSVPLRFASVSTGLLSKYPYGLWMDAVLADVVPGLSWEMCDQILVGHICPGLVLLLYVVSPTEIRMDLARNVEAEPLASFQYSLSSFSAGAFFRWFRVVVNHIETTVAEMDKKLYGDLPVKYPSLQVLWPVAGLEFPIACTRRGERRSTSRIFEDFESLSRDTSLWPLCGLCVVLGSSGEVLTRMASLLARADQAAAKNRSIYVFRMGSIGTIQEASGELQQKVLSRLCMCPDDENPQEFLRNVLQGDAQTVIADLGAEISNSEVGAPWADQARVLARNPTNRILFLRTDLPAIDACGIVGDQFPDVARIYWTESVGRLCPVMENFQSGVRGNTLPCGVIYPPFA